MTEKISSKQEAFKRIAERRTNKVLDALRLLGQCSNKRSYEYSDIQISKIFREIRKGVREAELRFSGAKTENKFRL
jgi:hypothetical protein